MVNNMSKAYVQIRSRFSVRAKRKCINFSQITVATTALESGNGVFQTSLDFDKTKALLNLSMHFSKITYHKVYLGKIWKNRPPDDASPNFDIYWHGLLIIFSPGPYIRSMSYFVLVCRGEAYFGRVGLIFDLSSPMLIFAPALTLL